MMNKMMTYISRKLKDKAGFSFIEAILTTSLLSVGLWGGLAILQNATSHSVNNDFRIMGIQLANEKVELILADKSFKGFDYILAENYPSESLSDPFSGFTRTVSIIEVDPTDLNDTNTPMPGSGYKRVDVNVVWGVESHEQVSVSTVVTDYDS